MPRQTVPLKDVRSFVTELEAGGATGILRSPADVRGNVVVRWEPSAAEEADYAIALRTYRAQFVLSVIVLAILVAILVVTMSP